MGLSSKKEKEVGGVDTTKLFVIEIPPNDSVSTLQLFALHVARWQSGEGTMDGWMGRTETMTCLL